MADTASNFLGAAGGTDPLPYVVLAYGLGALALFGYAAWLLRQSSLLKTILAEVRAAAPARRQ